ncbi:HAD-IIIA family hydrolase [Streptomyces sp. NPDC007856]|uniref:D-glycero-alpha-D-manno-heptose-1,7-bisphosphate 7-phosphatase n=1 Tax=Streptomyces sp. NPDC007856 TaxID=3364781 RepID=UPI0036B56037
MNPCSAVLFDRDGTLVADVPYNGDPDRVRLLPGAAAAVELVRSHGLATGVISNQSGIGRGLLTADAVHRVNERADALLGGLDTWLFCPHAPDAGCDCRKPRPGLVLAAAARLGVPPGVCLVIGDIAADVLAARAAGARGVLVPNAATAPDEVARFAAQSAPDLLIAVRTALTAAADPDGTRSASPEGAGAMCSVSPRATAPGRVRFPSPSPSPLSDATAAGRMRSCSPQPTAPGRTPSPAADPAVPGRPLWPSPDSASPAGARPSRQGAAAPDRVWPSEGDAAVPGRRPSP